VETALRVIARVQSVMNLAHEVVNGMRTGILLHAPDNTITAV